MKGFSYTSLRIRLVMVVLLAVMPVLGLMFYTVLQECRYELKNAQKEALLLAKFISADQEKLIQGAHQLLAVLAQLQEVANRDLTACNVLFGNLIEKFAVYHNLMLVDAEGNVLGSGIPIVRPISVADMSWFSRAVTVRDFVVGDYAYDHISYRPVIFLGYPVVGRNDRVETVVCASLNLSWFNQTLSRSHLPEDATLTLLDHHGIILARYPERDEWVGRPMPESFITKKIFSEREGVAEGEGVDGISRLYGFTALPGVLKDVYVSVGIPKAAALARIKAILIRSLVLPGLAGMLALITIFAVGEVFFLRRVRMLMKAAERLAHGDLSARTGMRYGRGELSQLAKTFDEMADALERRQIESEQLEEVLRESGRRFRAIFNQTFQFTAVLEPDGMVLEANQTILDFAGLKNADVFGLQFWETPWFKNSQKVQQRLGEAISRASKGELVRHEVEIWGAGDKVATIDLSLKPLRGDAGHVALLIAEGRDITQRKEAERALCESESRHRAIIEDQTELIARFLKNGEITFVNEAYCRYYGKPREEWIGQSYLHDVHDEEVSKLREHLEALNRENPVAMIEHRVVAPAGEVRWQQWTTRAILDDKGEIVEYQAVGRDVTERKAAEEALRESEKQLRYLSAQLLKAQEGERRHIARELHDSIGQSLSAIKFGVQNAIKHFEKNTSTNGMKSLETLVPMVQYAIDEIRKIMTDLRPSILDDLGILATISWFCREYQSIYSQIHIEREVDIQEEDVPESLKIVIFRIMQEALNNIAKHSGAQFVTLSLKRKDSGIELVIEDDGQGFDLESTVCGDEGKRGFGLSSMRERAELSGGSFAMESVKGSGTAIKIMWMCKGQ